MRVGLVDVKDGGSWGPVSTDDGRCRKGHLYTPWEHRADEREVTFYRGCRRCGWMFCAVPVIAGPHRLARMLGDYRMCLCGSLLPHA